MHCLHRAIQPDLSSKSATMSLSRGSWKAAQWNLLPKWEVRTNRQNLPGSAAHVVSPHSISMLSFNFLLLVAVAAFHFVVIRTN